MADNPPPYGTDVIASDYVFPGIAWAMATEMASRAKNNRYLPHEARSGERQQRGESGRNRIYK